MGKIYTNALVDKIQLKIDSKKSSILAQQDEIDRLNKFVEKGT